MKKTLIITSIVMLIGLALITYGCLQIKRQVIEPVKVQPCNTEYQFNVDQTGYDIYSDGKLIGRINYGSNPTLDSLIDFDNQ